MDYLMTVNYDAGTQTWRVGILSIDGALADPLTDPATIFPAAELGISRESVDRYGELELAIWRRALAGAGAGTNTEATNDIRELQGIVDAWQAAARRVLDPLVRRSAALVGWSEGVIPGGLGGY